MVYTGGGVDPVGCLGAAHEAGEDARLPVHQHAHGAGRLSRERSAVPGHARACTAPTKPTWRCRTATCCSPSARASTTGSSATLRDFAQVQRKIIHIDIDPSSISKRVKVDVPIVGNVSDVLDELIRQLEAAGYKPDQKALERLVVPDRRCGNRRTA